jgi:ankyrin repeat protein
MLFGRKLIVKMLVLECYCHCSEARLDSTWFHMCNQALAGADGSLLTVNANKGASRYISRNLFTRQQQCRNEEFILNLRGGGFDLLDWMTVPALDLENSEHKEINKKLLEAAESGDVESIDLCMRAGAEINARGLGFWSALHKAARYGHAKACERLVHYGANIEHRSGCHFTALHHAAMRDHSDTVTTLASLSGDLLSISLEGHTVMDWAARNGHVKTVLAIISLLKGQPQQFDLGEVGGRGKEADGTLTHAHSRVRRVVAGAG